MIFSQSEVWGHRGWPSRYPDNTAAGIRAAATVAAGVESTSGAPADGRLVLSHDPEIGRDVVAVNSWERWPGSTVEGHLPPFSKRCLDIPVLSISRSRTIRPNPASTPSHRGPRKWPPTLGRATWSPRSGGRRWMRCGNPRGRRTQGCCSNRPVDPIAAIRHAVDKGHRVVAPQHVLIDPKSWSSRGQRGSKWWPGPWTTPARQIRLAELGVAAIITNRPGELIAEAQL
jgi:hypothetical protein